MFAFPLLIGLIIGAVMGKVCEGIVTVIPFMFLRKFSGGYHAKYWWLCIVISSTVLGTALYIDFIHDDFDFVFNFINLRRNLLNELNSVL